MKTRAREQTFSTEQISIRVFDKIFKREYNLYIVPGNMIAHTRWQASNTISLTFLTTWRKVHEEAKHEMIAVS